MCARFSQPTVPAVPLQTAGKEKKRRILSPGAPLKPSLKDSSHTPPAASSRRSSASDVAGGTAGSIVGGGGKSVAGAKGSGGLQQVYAIDSAEARKQEAMTLADLVTKIFAASYSPGRELRGVRTLVD